MRLFLKAIHSSHASRTQHRPGCLTRHTDYCLPAGPGEATTSSVQRQHLIVSSPHPT